MVFSGGQFFGGSVAADDCVPPGCGDAVAGSHALGGSTFFLWGTFFAGLALALLAGACALGDWAEEGFVVSGGAGCCAVCSCATCAFADESDRGAERAISPGSTNVSEEIPRNRMVAARVMLGPVERKANLHPYYALMRCQATESWATNEIVNLRAERLLHPRHVRSAPESPPQWVYESGTQFRWPQTTRSPPCRNATAEFDRSAPARCRCLPSWL